ncbi:hypothetical protein C8A01DRAFT_19951 [Parachaetomium inaequale]|uniref:Uncharacterized protein n=1 Tax=Parachaetomium inaequale TaxID=2588326 RepID=A0AAN6P7D6_9PEZI|nr:hypothetical protein C8A01DRAFT_19951 [Parachaetomium inaequale]
MPATFSIVDRAPGPPGAPGSLAWHRRRRQTRALSPESPRARSRSASPEDRPLNASQPAESAARAASPDQLPRSATQPVRSAPKRARESRSEKKRKEELKQAAETTRSEFLKVAANIQEFQRRRHRTAAPSPTPREVADQPPDESGSASEGEEAVPFQSPSPKQAKFSRKDKGKGKEVIARVALQEETTAVSGSPILDVNHEPPPSAQPLLRQRGRRDSDSKARKTRKSSRLPNTGLDEGSKAGVLYDLLDQAALELANSDIRADADDGPSEDGDSEPTGRTHSRSPVLDEYLSDGGASAGPSAAGSQRSQSDSGYAEADGQGPSVSKPGTDMDVPDGLPHYEDDDHFAAGGGVSQGDDDAMSVVSEPHGIPVVTDVPVFSAVPDVDEEMDGEGAPVQPEPISTPPEQSAKNPGPGRSAKRKAKMTFSPNQDDENVKAFAELPLEDAGAPTVARKTKRKKPQKQPAADTAAEDLDEQASAAERSQYRSGPLSKTEQAQITRAVERFRQDEDLTQEEVNRVMHDNPRTSDRPINRQLWASIQDACPSRPRKKLINWCRQTFHNWAGRGTWTQEQDDELAELVEKHGKKWSHIAGLINRYQKDVRDRWRNYLVCRETVKTDVWSESEEERFRELVETSIEKIREGMSENSSKSPDELLNWLNISQAMGHTRSRLQCMEKWKRMRAAEPLADKVPTVLPSGTSWRLEKARGDLRKITASDKYLLMCAIRDSGVGTDAKINWKQIVNDTFRGNYERQALVVTWGRLRKSVPDWEWKTTRDCARYLCEMYESEGGFGTAAQGERAEAEDDTVVSTTKRRKKGKKVARAASADNLAPEPQSQVTTSEDAAEKGNSSAAKESLRKRGKKQSKTTSDAAPPEARSKTGESADEDAPAPTKSHAKSAKKSRQVKKEHSPELDTAPPEPSPSVKAQAARSRRRERRGSTVERTSPKEEVLPPTPKASSSKVSKRPRRGSLANGNMESPRAKKQKTSSSSASKRKVREVDDMPKSGRKSWSDISSDMDDMEDIPATQPTSSQAAR